MEKLKEPNWITRKFLMRHFLMAKILWGLVDVSTVLAANATAEAPKNVPVFTQYECSSTAQPFFQNGDKKGTARSVVLALYGHSVLSEPLAILTARFSDTVDPYLKLLAYSSFVY